MNKLTKSSVGRPTKKDDEVIAKLDSIFKVGGTIDEACSYAGIDHSTYHRWMDSDKGFATKMTAAQHYADVVAKNVVVDSIVKDRDLSTAKWWLEKRQFKEGTNVQVNVVVPILGEDDAE